MAEVRGRAVRPVGYTQQWILDATQGIPPLQIAAEDDGTMSLSFPSDVSDAVLETVKQRMETADDAEAEIVTQLAADYDANAEAMPFQNAQVQALTEQMQRVIRLVTGRRDAAEVPAAAPQ